MHNGWWRKLTADALQAWSCCSWARCLFATLHVGYPTGRKATAFKAVLCGRWCGVMPMHVMLNQQRA